ncbi:hypothetical protein [Pseudolactococcus insecticola]|uniref:Uncharacterized protein n=1 Tax=Pseudolactococcus insecticola TaxID=2709158 RepID=A0A6A0B8C7_9LACT|nr:hypothetical protein [Lactococcus insecticola]GFH40708.1 hypothetical protein Hs20B_11060 [Lactococcus insecticola]
MDVKNVSKFLYKWVKITTDTEVFEGYFTDYADDWEENDDEDIVLLRNEDK